MYNLTFLDYFKVKMYLFNFFYEDNCQKNIKNN